MASFAWTILTAALTMIIFISESAIREHMDDRAELKTTQKCDFDGSLSRERSGSTVSPWRCILDEDLDDDQENQDQGDQDEDLYYDDLYLGDFNEDPDREVEMTIINLQYEMNAVFLHCTVPFKHVW